MRTSLDTHASRSPLRIAIVNDYRVVVDGVSAMLAERSDRIVVLSADTNTDTDVASSHVAAADLVLYDPFASDRTLEVAIAALSAAGQDRVVVFTWRRSQAEIAEAFALGAAGYLSKTLGPDALVAALEAVHRGERVVVPAPRSPRTAPQGDWPGSAVGLTPRESEILCLIGKGLTNQEISIYAHVGSESLKTHIRSAYGRIGVTRRSQAIVWCVRNGLMSDD